VRQAIAKRFKSDYIAASMSPRVAFVARKSSASKSAKKPAEPEQEVVETEQEGDPPAPASTDNVGDISVEVNVEDLIAQIESESKSGAPDGSARRKIEDILEEKRIAREIMDLDDFDIDD
jgi:hypothetical protein